MKIQNETILGSQPKTALARSFPCMLNLLNSSQPDLSGMIYHSMASGSHLLALSIGSSIATVMSKESIITTSNANCHYRVYRTLFHLSDQANDNSIWSKLYFTFYFMCFCSSACRLDDLCIFRQGKNQNSFV